MTMNMSMKTKLAIWGCAAAAVILGTNYLSMNVFSHDPVIMACIALATLAVLVMAIARDVTQPLQRARKTLQMLAAGDWRAEVSDTTRGDEFGDLGRAMQTLRDTVKETARYAGQAEALTHSQAMIEFNMDGTIVTANQNFLDTVGYTLDEIKGKHHSMFAEPEYRSSQAYRDFWAVLNQGQFQTGEFRRLGKNGKEVWIQGSYNPVMDAQGKPVCVVKYVIDVTKQKLAAADFAGQLAAIGKVQAVIEFDLDGTIITANENFLATLGYTLDEIKGKRHSMFVEPAYRDSADYRAFWDNLRHGQFQAGEFKRIAKGGREVWISASYNPIFDLSGKPFKVVKYATDITLQKIAIAKINDLIAAATAGDLQQRIDTTAFTGFYKDMTTSMNGLMDSVGLPIMKAVEILNNVSHGDLTQPMEGFYQGAFASMQKALNDTIDSLSSMVRRITETASTVNTAASEIASGSSDLSMRTEQQASSLEETAASMEELTSTVKQNSQSALAAKDLATTASGVANEGGKVVENAVTAMAAIEQSSQKISDIIGVIDEIAFQTNLLALNAAVEAARAGDAGKGFAVVASEVRALAGRSATASKEIKNLINDSASQVKTGSGLVREAGDTLRNIVSSVRKVADIVSDIANASSQQANGIGEINVAVSQMDEMTQQNAALVEENTAASHSMVQQAKSLESLISFFRVDNSQYAATATGNLGSAPVAMSKPAAKPVSTLAKKPAHKLEVVGTQAGRAIGNTATANAYDQGWEEF